MLSCYKKLGFGLGFPSFLYVFYVDFAKNSLIVTKHDPLFARKFLCYQIVFISLGISSFPYHFQIPREIIKCTLKEVAWSRAPSNDSPSPSSRLSSHSQLPYASKNTKVQGPRLQSAWFNIVVELHNSMWPFFYSSSLLNLIIVWKSRILNLIGRMGGWICISW